MIFIIVGLLFFVQQCTTINLIPSLVSNKDNFRYLSEEVSSTNFVVDKISDKTYLWIYYDTINNYFIVDDSYHQKKISADGNILFDLSDPSAEMPYKTHYVFTDSSVYDFSKNKVEKEPYFERIIFLTEELEKKWILLFKELYDKASVVIYGNNELIYFKIPSGWVALKVSEFRFLKGDNTSERTFENYPAKYNKLIFLKDIKSNTYSEWMSHSGSSADKKRRNYDLDNADYPEKKINYVENKIEKISLKKTKIHSTFTYTPIISHFIGIGYYKLKKENEYIRFKENAIKYPFYFLQSDSYLNNYTIPEEFEPKTNISFIRYSYPSNTNESKSQGLYIVKKKY
ncbi:hypothetical protein [Maribacter sp. Asnod1-A12]|uniref:hypothetical protein n=1 Tax=Maribacter sp. Asnod1-A12 TaxID=3160576 RepID=UPI00386D8F8F